MALFFLSSQYSTFEANVPGRRMVHGIPRGAQPLLAVPVPMRQRGWGHEVRIHVPRGELDDMPDAPFLGRHIGIAFHGGKHGAGREHKRLVHAGKGGCERFWLFEISVDDFDRFGESLRLFWVAHQRPHSLARCGQLLDHFASNRSGRARN